LTLNRRDALVLAAAAATLGLTGVPAFAQDGTTHDVNKLMADLALPDKPIGQADAPVTLIEYASPTCPHCAAFHEQTYPLLKSEYVDTGKVQFILRPFVRNVLDAVVFMLAEAAGPTSYNNVIDTYFRTQQTWATSNTPRDALLEIALQLGFTQESFEAALTNQDLFTAMETMRDQALNEFGLTGTPTFYINGKQLSGDVSIETLAAEIDPLVGEMPAAPATEAPAAGAATPVAPAEPAPAAPATPVEPAPATPVAPAN